VRQTKWVEADQRFFEQIRSFRDNAERAKVNGGTNLRFINSLGKRGFFVRRFWSRVGSHLLRQKPNRRALFAGVCLNPYTAHGCGSSQFETKNRYRTLIIY